MLLAFRAPLAPVIGKELPSRLLLAKWGRNENVKGAEVIVNETTVRHLPGVNRALGRDTIALDFEHETVEGSDAFKASQEPRKVAAHGVPRVIQGEGLFIEQIRWTPEGEASVKGGHHPDLSPAVKTNERGEVLFLHSGALCRHGAIPDLQVFTAGLSAGELTTLSATVSPQPPPPMLDHKKLTIALLGLADTATDEQILGAAQTFAANVKTTHAAAGEITALSATVKTLGEKLAALQLAGETAERDAITATALRDGKLIPLTAHKLGLADFKTFVGELTAGVVPLEKRTPDAVKTFSATVGKGDESAAEQVRQAMGVSKEAWAKHNAA